MHRRPMETKSVEGVFVKSMSFRHWIHLAGKALVSMVMVMVVFGGLGSRPGGRRRR